MGSIPCHWAYLRIKKCDKPLFLKGLVAVVDPDCIVCVFLFFLKGGALTQGGGSMLRLILWLFRPRPHNSIPYSFPQLHSRPIVLLRLKNEGQLQYRGNTDTVD